MKYTFRIRMGSRGARALGGATVLGLMLALGQTGGCSGEPSNKSQLALGQFPAAYAQTLCQSLAHCCTENQIQFSQTDCTAGWKDFVNKLLADPIVAGNYDPRVATECVRLVSAAEGATCNPDPGSISAARSTCQRILQGKKPLGAQCKSSAECAPIEGQRVGCEGQPLIDPDAGLLPLAVDMKLRPQAGPPGPPVCIVLQPVEVGQKCNTPALQALCNANEDTVCDTMDGICKKLASAGEPCKPGQCAATLYCDGTTGVCSPQLGPGEPCKTNEECASFYRCDTAAGRCADRKRPGEPCTNNGECSIGICDTVTRKCLANAIATSESCHGKEPPRLVP